MGNGSIRVSNASKKAKYVWAVPNFPEMQLSVIAGFCEAIANNRENFRYSFLFRKDTHLDITNNTLVVNGDDEGFTCATFVLAILWSRKAKLINVDTWYNDSDDEAWQKETLQKFKDNQQSWGVSDDDIDAMTQELADNLCLRFPPYSLVGACRSGHHPTQCATSRFLGKQARKWLSDALDMF